MKLANRPLSLLVICGVMTWCGIWTTLGGAIITHEGLRGDLFTAAGVLFIVMGVLCFTSALGLFNRQPWAPRSALCLATVFLASNFLIYSICGLLQDARAIMLLLFPVGFLAFLGWSMRRQLHTAEWIRMLANPVRMTEER